LLGADGAASALRALFGWAVTGAEAGAWALDSYDPIGAIWLGEDAGLATSLAQSTMEQVIFFWVFFWELFLLVDEDDGATCPSS
jgi:hypothetical protein